MWHTHASALILALAVWSQTSAFHTFLPHDKEVVYNYRAIVRSGTHYPTHHASYFEMHGHLHVQATSNHSHFKFQDLKHRLYTGVLDHEHENKVPFVVHPENEKDLHKVFKIVYDVDGKVLGLSTEADEHEYSRNIKRALATIFQMDVPQVKHIDGYGGFMTLEKSNHGPSNFQYHVHKHDDEKIEVTKMSQMETVSSAYRWMQNGENWHCDMTIDQPVAHDSQKVYIIKKHEGHHTVVHIESNGGIYYSPFQGKSDSHYVFVNQTLEFKEVVAIKEPLHLTSEHHESSIVHHVYDDKQESGRAPDVAFGRTLIDKKALEASVHKGLQDLVKSFDLDQLHSTHSNANEHGVSYIIDLLAHFDTMHLDSFCHSFPDHNIDFNADHVTEHELFLHVLPMVGTKASVKLIKKLVLEKKIPEKMKAHLLEMYPRNVRHATREFVTEMESLNKMTDLGNWEVRKAAILSFGMLVHKAYFTEVHPHDESFHSHHQTESTHDDGHHHDASMDVHHHNHQNNEVDGWYEKYVQDYVQRFTSASDFKEQKVYLEGLQNMKMRTVHKHLVPILHKTMNHHIKLLLIKAIVPSIIHHPIEVHQLLIHFLTNPHEHSEIRIYSYHMIMQSNPSISTVLNVYWHLIKEHNDELYHFHYTYMHALSKSWDFCHGQLRITAGQLLNYMKPPQSGLSHYHVNGYMDLNFAFGTFHNMMFVHTNESMLLDFYITAQIMGKFTEDYRVYVKVHGLEDHFGLRILTESASKMFNFNSVMEFISHLQENKNLHIEVAIVKHQQIVISHFYDHRSLGEFLTLLTHFISHHGHGSPLHKHLLHIDYQSFNRVYMPTDIGFTASWDYIMPFILQHKTQFTNDGAANKILNFHVDNRYTVGIHLHHGLMFYNPIANAVQGIQKHHHYDSVMPIFVDLNVNIQQQTMKLTWKKHSDVHKDVMGVRVHVANKVLTCFMDQHHPNHVGQYEWITVSHGDKYRHDFTLMDKDDFTTGMKWHMSIFDTEHHISNGTFSYLMNSFMQPYTKQATTVYDYMQTAYRNLFNYLIIMPEKGTNGFLLRVEPSTVHHVTNVDLFMRFHEDMTRDKTLLYAPAVRYSTRATLSIKNQEKSLRTWDLDAVLDMNIGHTINNLKMIITRIVPGQKNLKVCIDGTKKWFQNGVSGHTTVALSHAETEKCTKDDVIVDITMNGEKSHEQTHEDHVYGSCERFVPYDVHRHHTLQCLSDHTSVRKYTYNVITAKVPTEFQIFFNNLWDVIRGHKMWHYLVDIEHHEQVPEHHLKIDMLYPMEGNEVDMHIYTHTHAYHLTALPVDHLSAVGVEPDTHFFSKMFMFLHKIGMVDHCYVDTHHVHSDHVDKGKALSSSEWTTLLSDAPQHGKHVVNTKLMGDHHMSLQVLEKEHNLEIHPHDDDYKITVDGKEITLDEYRSEWVHFHRIRKDDVHSVLIHIPSVGTIVDFHKDHMLSMVPRLDKDWHGHCFTY